MNSITRYLTVYSALAVLSSCASSQQISVQTPQGMGESPQLIVGITVDQMRYDYLQRYWNDFVSGGFKRLVGEGFVCHNLHYNYMPTYTGPGHASIFSGTTPAYHGIIQNDWYDRESNSMIYCSSDTTVKGVGTASKAGQMSPQYLTASTIGDMLLMHTNRRGKVFGIAMKDRGAILPAGRTADAAYWFVGADEGVWASSTWYMQQLPEWVNSYNTKLKPNDYLSQTWNLLRPESVYDESAEDNNAHETPFKGTTRPTFPYDLAQLKSANGNYDLIKATPFGNTLTIDFAKALIENERLGDDATTDMLCMSFSSTDYIGHQFGVHARETQDCYLRLDEELAELLTYLDQRVGKGKYLVFLSADHGGAPTPSYTAKRRAIGGYWKSDRLEAMLEDSLVKKYGAGDWIVNESNQNIFINRSLASLRKLSLKEIQYEVASLTLSIPEVQQAFTGSDLLQFRSGDAIKDMVQRGFDSRRSGDVIYTLKPGYIEYGLTGTTHGSPYVYDTHVPALFFGFGVQSGETYERYSIADIAPTVSMMSRLPLPDAATGVPIVQSIAIRK